MNTTICILLGVAIVAIVAGIIYYDDPHAGG